MKNLSLILNAILLVAVAILFFVVFSNTPAKQEQPITQEDPGNTIEPVVFINTDSLLLKYEFARTLNENFLKKEENSRADFNEQAKVFQQDMVSFQRKVKNNAFLSLERAQNEEKTLRQKEQELRELDNKLSNDLVREQNQMNQQLRDTLTSFLELYTQSHPHKLVLSNTLGDNLLYGESALDITNQVVEQLNKRYQESIKK